EYELHRYGTFLFFSSRRRHTRSKRDWSSDVCSSDLDLGQDNVYDFVGEVLEDRVADLPSVMEQALMGRQDLDEIIASMEKTLSRWEERRVGKESMDVVQRKERQRE